MPSNGDPVEVATALRVGVGALIRRLKKLSYHSLLSMPESLALALLDRGGPSTASELAKREQMTAQSMGATLAGLEARGFVKRSADPADGRRAVMALTPAGLEIVLQRRDESVQAMAATLTTRFTADERALLHDAAVLLERLAQEL